MSRFKWQQFGDYCYRAKVGEFLAEVYGVDDGWEFWFAGGSDGVSYQSREVAMGACEVAATKWIVMACNELGFSVRATTITQSMKRVWT